MFGIKKERTHSDAVKDSTRALEVIRTSLENGGAHVRMNNTILGLMAHHWMI